MDGFILFFFFLDKAIMLGFFLTVDYERWTIRGQSQSRREGVCVVWEKKKWFSGCGCRWRDSCVCASVWVRLCVCERQTRSENRTVLLVSFSKIIVCVINRWFSYTIMSCVHKLPKSEGNLIVCSVNLAKGRGLFQLDTRYILSSQGKWILF